MSEHTIVRQMRWIVWLGVIGALLLLAGCGGAPDAQVKPVAEKAFAAWAKVRSVPYREALITVESNDNVYANVRVVAQFRPSQAAPWEEWEATMECRYVGKEWQCNQGLDFALTAGEEGRRAAATATVVAAEQATAQAYAAATVTVVAAERATAQAAGGPWVNDQDGASYVYVSVGEFLMGSTDADLNAGIDEKPQHTVSLDGFWIMQTEATNAQYEKCVAARGCTAPHGTRWQKSGYADHPVVNVDWAQADAYCRWAGGRLPTEVEWEKAARGTDGRIYPWGNEAPDGQRANFDSNVGDTEPVGSYPSGASPYGALDMAGNVWEWVADWYDTSGGDRVLHGGGWSNNADLLRVAYRLNLDTTFWGNRDFGFRCVAVPEM